MRSPDPSRAKALRHCAQTRPPSTATVMPAAPDPKKLDVNDLAPQRLYMAHNFFSGPSDCISQAIHKRAQKHEKCASLSVLSAPPPAHRRAHRACDAATSVRIRGATWRAMYMRRQAQTAPARWPLAQTFPRDRAVVVEHRNRLSKKSKSHSLSEGARGPHYRVGLQGRNLLPLRAAL